MQIARMRPQRRTARMLLAQVRAVRMEYTLILCLSRAVTEPSQLVASACCEGQSHVREGG